MPEIRSVVNKLKIFHILFYSTKYISNNLLMLLLSFYASYAFLDFSAYEQHIFVHNKSSLCFLG